MSGSSFARSALIYVGDPMCSWCYGFGHELSIALAQRPRVQLEIVTGGLRAGGTEVLDDAGKRFRLFHWAKVEAATGLPFNREALLARQGFVYDTEPVCRAVVAARTTAPQADQLAVFRALQKAFYVDGMDTTDPDVLAGVAAQALQAQGFAADGLRACFDAEDTRKSTREEFAQVRRWGVSSFPALLAWDGGQMVRLVDGFAKSQALVTAMDQWANAVPSSARPG